MLADPPGPLNHVYELVLWVLPVIFLLVVTGVLLTLHLGLAPPAKRVLNGWLIILMPLLSVIYCILCRPLLSSVFGKPFAGIWWMILLYPSLVVVYWLVFRWRFDKNIEKTSADPRE